MAENLKHTEGPWRIQFMADDETEDFWVKSDFNEVTGYGTDILCDDFGNHVGYTREQRLADAKLIAAAPDMLEALKDAKSFIFNIQAPVHEGTIEDLRSKINDAISKATE